MENRFKDDTSVAFDFACEVEVSFFTKASEAAYSTSLYFNKEKSQNNEWELLCSEDDLREIGWLPELKNRCCYLMHEVVYHSSLMEDIFNIESIWINIKAINHNISWYTWNG